MEKSKKLVAEQPAGHLTEAWNMVESGTKLLQASVNLMHFINITIKNYSTLASNFGFMGSPIMSMARPEIGSISIAQYDEITRFLDITKKVSGCFSVITISIIDAVGEPHFMNNSLLKSKEMETLLSIDDKLNIIFRNLLSYKNKISTLDYSKVHHGLTVIMNQHSRNLAAARNTIRAAEKILGAILSIQRGLESSIQTRA